MKQIKNNKSIILSIVFLLLLSPLLTSVGDASSSNDFTDMPKIEREEIKQVISKSDAIEVAKKYKLEFDQDNILNTDSKNEKPSILDDKVYNLFNMENNLIAYLILTEKGYIVVNANIENSKVLTISEYGDSLESINRQISQDSKLYFIFPFTILTENEKNDYLSKNKLNKTDIISIPKINLSSEGSTTEDISPLASNISVSLRNEASFVNLNGTYYGGNQSWFNSKTDRDKGCGVIALTNVISHLANYGHPRLYNDGNTTLPVNYNNYKNKMEGLADHYLSPGWFGIPVVSAYTSAANKFFKDKGYSNLHSYTFSSNYATNIKNGLNKNQPVPMLIWSDGDNSPPNLNKHWITITKYFKNGTTNEQFIAFSSWGRRYSVNLDSLLSGYVRGATYMN